MFPHPHPHPNNHNNHNDRHSNRRPPHPGPQFPSLYDAQGRPDPQAMLQRLDHLDAILAHRVGDPQADALRQRLEMLRAVVERLQGGRRGRHGRRGQHGRHGGHGVGRLDGEVYGLERLDGEGNGPGDGLVDGFGIMQQTRGGDMGMWERLQMYMQMRGLGGRGGMVLPMHGAEERFGNPYDGDDAYVARGGFGGLAEMYFGPEMGRGGRHGGRRGGGGGAGYGGYGGYAPFAGGPFAGHSGF